MSLLSINIDSKVYSGSKNTLKVLEDIHLEIGEGELVCIAGPSGCGKTTFLNILAGLDSDYSGRVLYKGAPIIKCSQERMMIFQELGLFPWLNVQNNVEFGLKMKGIPKKKREQIALKYLEMVNLVKFKDYFIHNLSGGMKQRVALARALAMEPQVLLMDEPFASLDAQTRDMLHLELQKIWIATKKTIIFVTHNVREAVCLGDRVLVFSLAPAHVKASFKIDLARPRQIESEGLIEKVRPILTELKFEIERDYE
ncbi:MAG: ABC transporter ATP-binding protein [Candidatus Omnitrophica bacterium]|nr:ABC transporter ATP-binding protein [Candidatus Omnitrophota bacterium]MBU1922985.1 ABC transporter ATP-binding protein [Candidatus Omnitrophota bacterium]